MLDDEPLIAPHPSYPTVLRLRGLFSLIPFIGAALGLGITQVVPPWIPGMAILLLAILWVGVVPSRRYRQLGHAVAQDRLRIAQGAFYRSDMVVPFSRVQHLDVEQGPIERAFGIARLQLFTAGTHGDTIELPGLSHDDAVALRETVRERIARFQA